MRLPPWIGAAARAVLTALAQRRPATLPTPTGINPGATPPPAFNPDARVPSADPAENPPGVPYVWPPPAATQPRIDAPADAPHITDDGRP